MHLCSFRKIRVHTWTFFSAASQDASLQMWRTDLRSAWKIQEQLWRKGRMLIRHLLYVDLRSVMRRENKPTFFHWTVLTVTNTHFTRLHTNGWTSIAAHVQKLILSVWFVFGYYNGWHVEMYCISPQKEVRTVLCPLWVVLSPCFCSSLVPYLLRKAVKVEGRKGLAGPSRDERHLMLSTLSFNFIPHF